MSAYDIVYQIVGTKLLVWIIMDITQSKIAYIIRAVYKTYDVFYMRVHQITTPQAPSISVPFSEPILCRLQCVILQLQTQLIHGIRMWPSLGLRLSRKTKCTTTDIKSWVKCYACFFLFFFFYISLAICDFGFVFLGQVTLFSITGQNKTAITETRAMIRGKIRHVKL